MSDNAGRPAARAIAPPPDPKPGDLSGPRLAAARSEAPATTPGRPLATDWAMATAPTLLLKPVDGESDDAASTSRIPTAPPMPDDSASTSRIPTSPPTTGLEEQPWFKTGTTMPPPSMRPMAGESIAPAPRRPPNPRVLKVVFGVIAGCLFIVAIAAIKLVSKKASAPAVAASTETSSAPKVALAEPAKALPPENPPSAVPPPAAQEQPPPPAPAETAQHAAPARPTPAPRTTTKTTTHRAPAPKKPVRGTR